MSRPAGGGALGAFTRLRGFSRGGAGIEGAAEPAPEGDCFAGSQPIASSRRTASLTWSPCTGFTR